MKSAAPLDAVVVGGGFYGCAIAIYLAKHRGLKRVNLVEREAALLTRASYNNQARVHNGYHYPRSYTTAYRSRINLPQFVQDFPDAVRRDFVKLYAIAKVNSKVTPRQFMRFCQEIGAKIEQADDSLRQMFEPRLIDAVFLVEEYVFDTSHLARWATQELSQLGVEVTLSSSVTHIHRNDAARCLQVSLSTDGAQRDPIECLTVINCTYSGLNQIRGDFPATRTRLKHEITEMALIEAPTRLAGLGITVMDGPFFSLMPFPARGLQTLSHVRYTPHLHWDDLPEVDPYQRLADYDQATRVDRMIRDAARFLPAMLEARYAGSLFEVKTLLKKNESDDGRPILFEKHPELPGCYSVLGSKIDNIYDALLRLEEENFG